MTTSAAASSHALPAITPIQLDTPKPTLVYVYDAMCSWCFGFEPVVQKFSAQKAGDLNFQLVSGGMSLPPRAAHIKDILGEDPRPIYQQLIDTTGAPITDAYLDGLVARDNYIVDSTRPALAMAALRILVGDTSRDLEFAIAMQTAMYTGGLNPNGDEYYRTAAGALGVDAEALLDAMTTDAAVEGAEADFALSQGLGTRGFPAVYLRGTGGTYVQILSGYAPIEVLTENTRRGLELLEGRGEGAMSSGQACGPDGCAPTDSGSVGI